MKKISNKGIKNNILKTEKDELFSGVLWLNSGVLGLSLGVLFGIILFIATNWLVFIGGENPGKHLNLLSHFFIGYKVFFLGSFIGFVYGFALGTISGALIAWFYNMFIKFRNYRKMFYNIVEKIINIQMVVQKNHGRV
jgi:hypothetical protein